MSLKNLIVEAGLFMRGAGNALANMPAIVEGMASDATPEEVRAMLRAFVEMTAECNLDRAAASRPDVQQMFADVAARLDAAPSWKRVLTAPYVAQMVTNEQWEEAGVEGEPGLIVDENECRWFEACNAGEFGEDEADAYAPHYDQCTVSGHGVFAVFLGGEWVVFAES